jgi:hypothetical protein
MNNIEVASDAPCILILSEFSISKSVIGYILLSCNPWHVRRDRSDLIDESRDEILFKGGRLWRPMFWISIISANDRTNWVKPADVGQTMVNLGHHLENRVNSP